MITQTLEGVQGLLTFHSNQSEKYTQAYIDTNENTYLIINRSLLIKPI